MQALQLAHVSTAKPYIHIHILIRTETLLFEI